MRGTAPYALSRKQVFKGLHRLPPLLDDIQTDIVSDVRWTTLNRLGLSSRRGTWTTVNLDTNVLAADLAARLTRSFTDRDCQTFNIEPCPTLEDIRGSA